MCNTVLQREYPQDAASAEQLRKRSFVQDSEASTPDQCCSAVSLLDGNTGASPVLTRFYVPLLPKPLLALLRLEHSERLGFRSHHMGKKESVMLDAVRLSITAGLLITFFVVTANSMAGDAPDGQSVQNGVGFAEPAVVSPDKPEQSRFPDEPLKERPAGAISVKFLVEHRTALNEKKATVHGVIVATLLGDKACPPDRGMCAQPRITIADSADASRNTSYDLEILLPEGVNDSYDIGQFVDVSGVISASPVAVVMR